MSIDKERYKIFNFFLEEHDMLLTDGQMDDIINIVNDYNKEINSENMLNNEDEFTL